MNSLHKERLIKLLLGVSSLMVETRAQATTLQNSARKFRIILFSRKLDGQGYVIFRYKHNIKCPHCGKRV